VSVSDYDNDRKLEIPRSVPKVKYSCISISGCRSWSQLPRDFFELAEVENPSFAVGISILSVLVLKILAYPVSAVKLLFPPVRRCRIYFSGLGLSLP